MWNWIKQLCSQVKTLVKNVFTLIKPSSTKEERKLAIRSINIHLRSFTVPVGIVLTFCGYLAVSFFMAFGLGVLFSTLDILLLDEIGFNIIPYVVLSVLVQYGGAYFFGYTSGILGVIYILLGESLAYYGFLYYFLVT